MSEFPKFTNNPKRGPDEPKSSTTELNAKQNIQDYDLICPICQETFTQIRRTILSVLVLWQRCSLLMHGTSHAIELANQ